MDELQLCVHVCDLQQDVNQEALALALTSMSNNYTVKGSNQDKNATSKKLGRLVLRLKLILLQLLCLRLRQCKSKNRADNKRQTFIG